MARPRDPDHRCYVLPSGAAVYHICTIVYHAATRTDMIISLCGRVTLTPLDLVYGEADAFYLKHEDAACNPRLRLCANCRTHLCPTSTPEP